MAQKSIQRRTWQKSRRSAAKRSEVQNLQTMEILPPPATPWKSDSCPSESDSQSTQQSRPSSALSSSGSQSVDSGFSASGGRGSSKNFTTDLSQYINPDLSAVRAQNTHSTEAFAAAWPPQFNAPTSQQNFCESAPQNPSPNSAVPLSDLAQYINPDINNSRVHSAIGNHLQGFQKKSSKPDTYKTVMCQAWLESMKCTFGENCKFAHGEQELRPARTQIRNHLKYKTKLCDKYTTSGICPYGSRCLFIHPAPSTKLPVNWTAPAAENIPRVPLAGVRTQTNDVHE